MDLEDLGNLGEFISGLAVTISVLYLAVQIRQNTRSLRAQAGDEARKQNLHLNEFLISNREVTLLAMAGSSDLESLDPADAARFDMLLMNTFLVYESVYLKSRSGLLEIERWPIYERRLVETLRRPGVRAWWEANADGFQEEFAELVNQRIQ